MLQLHHLVYSRSSRVIWLLETLGVEYELVTHLRGPGGKAEASLRSVHPLGKAPAIVDGELVLVESATILRYIAERYGDGRLMPAAGTSERARHDEWLDYAESSLMMPLIMKLMGRLGGSLPETLDHFATSELDRALDHIGSGIAQSRYLSGDSLTLADIQMSFCLALAELGGFMDGRPKLTDYWKVLQGEAGFKRMIEIGGPLVSISR